MKNNFDKHKRLHIGIIDDGVDATKYKIGSLMYSVEITPDLELRDWKQDKEGRSHGTVCAGIIHEYAPTAILSSIKILDSNCRGNVQQLARAIRWCRGQQFDIVNISLGSVCHNDFYILYDEVQKAIESGMIIVAACHNSGKYTYPASMDNVIGVRSLLHGSYDACFNAVHERYLSISNHEYGYYENSMDGINVVLSGWFQLGDASIVGGCNSYATAYVTACVYQIMRSGIRDKKQIDKFLRLNAAQHIFDYENTAKVIQSKYIVDVPPAIRVMDYTGVMLLTCMKSLEKNFFQDGYNCILVKNEQKTSIGIKKFINDMQLIARTYEYDILLYGGENSNDIWEKSSQLQQFDIHIIIISKETVRALEEVKEEKDLFVICVDEQSYQLCYARYKYVYLDNEMEQVYKQIIQLYEDA